MISFRFSAFFLFLWAFIAQVSSLPTPSITLQTYSDKSYNYIGQQTVNKGTVPSDDDMKEYATLAYHQMISVNQHEGSRNVPLTMSALYSPAHSTIIFASGVKDAGKKTSVAVSPVYDEAYSHRTYGNCAEMAAIARATTKNVPVNGIISTYGMRASGGEPVGLNPCRDETDFYGCSTYLKYYDIRATW